METREVELQRDLDTLRRLHSAEQERGNRIRSEVDDLEVRIARAVEHLESGKIDGVAKAIRVLTHA